MLSRFLHSDPDPVVVFYKKTAIGLLAFGTVFGILALIFL